MLRSSKHKVHVRMTEIWLVMHGFSHNPKAWTNSHLDLMMKLDEKWGDQQVYLEDECVYQIWCKSTQYLLMWECRKSQGITKHSKDYLLVTMTVYEFLGNLFKSLLRQSKWWPNISIPSTIQVTSHFSKKGYELLLADTD